MAGAYCNYCGFRCFVLRVIPDGPRKGWQGHMATCPQGMAHDLKVTQHTHLTAVNPVTDPEAATAIYAVTAGERGRKALALAVVEDGGDLSFAAVDVPAGHEGDVSECGHCKTRITFRLGEWMDDDFGSACTDITAPFVPHKPAEAVTR